VLSHRRLSLKKTSLRLANDSNSYDQAAESSTIRDKAGESTTTHDQDGDSNSHDDRAGVAISSHNQTGDSSSSLSCKQLPAPAVLHRHRRLSLKKTALGLTSDSNCCDPAGEATEASTSHDQAGEASTSHDHAGQSSSSRNPKSSIRFPPPAASRGRPKLTVKKTALGLA